MRTNSASELGSGAPSMLAMRMCLIVGGSIVAWLLYQEGNRQGWMEGILVALVGMAVGVVSNVAAIVISIRMMADMRESRLRSLALIVAAIAMIVLGASTMIKN